MRRWRYLVEGLVKILNITFLFYAKASQSGVLFLLVSFGT